MADSQLTRQQIYDRIRQSSKDDFVLEEMKRLGFWGKQVGEPTLPELMIKKEAELHKELNALWEERKRYQNKEAALKEMRLKKMALAKQQREETKQKRAAEKQAKSAAWAAQKKDSIWYLGSDIHIEIAGSAGSADALQKHGLPFFADEKVLAMAMGVDVSALHFLAYNRRVSEVNHYIKFYVPKKSGGKRLISAPMPRLKAVQHWILQNILNCVKVHTAVNGFANGKSIVTNANVHAGNAFVLNMDVKDFFPSVPYSRVKRLLQKLGYSEKIASILALLCTEAPTNEVELDGKRYFVQKGQRVLPQGSPASPALTNIICYRLDCRLQGLANKLQCTYTRYADDISFSGGESVNTQQLIWRIKKILQDEGFTAHPDKIKLMKKGYRQEVTGVIVNKQMNVPREKRRAFRALLHQLKNGSSNTLHWGKGQLFPGMIGYLNYLNMVNANTALKYKNEVKALLQLGKLVPPEAAKTDIASTATNLVQPTPSSGNSDKPEEPWWRVTG
jgi:RNA-directed DNA polymerase